MTRNTGPWVIEMRRFAFAVLYRAWQKAGFD